MAALLRPEETPRRVRQDLQHWLDSLIASGVDPLTELCRLHTYAWLRAQEADGA